MPYRITKSYTQCELCAEQCPIGAIEQDNNDNFVILDDCDECGECIKVCHVGAIVWEERLNSHLSLTERSDVSDVLI